MKSLLARSAALGAVLLIPAFTTLAQDPPPQRPVQYSAEELDNLVAPVALYADALLAQVLVAATFPDQIALAAAHVRAQGTKSVDDQDWDVSVRAIAHYPPVLNMLARQQDWTIALGQAYASQPGEVLDAVQRLRQMARDQGNLESTREQKVSVQRDYIVIEPANPEVIYVPTYEPYYVYAGPVYGYGYGYHFGFGIGFPYGPWLSYGCDWFAGRIYWHGGGCCGGAYVSPWVNTFGVLAPRTGVSPGNRYVPTNPDVYSRKANYANLDRDFRSVRRDVSFARHSKPAGGTAKGTAGTGDNRTASFSGIRRDGGTTSTTGTRYADPVSPNGVGKTKPGSGTTGDGPTVFRGSQASGTTFSSTVRTAEGKSRTGGPVVYRGGNGSTGSTFKSTTRTSGGKTSGGGPVVYRGSRPQSPQFTGATTRSTAGKAGNGGPIVYRGSSQARPAAGKGGVRSGGQALTQPMRAPSRGSFSGARSGSGFGSTTIRSSGGTGAAVRSAGGGTISGGAARISGFGGRRPD